MSCTNGFENLTRMKGMNQLACSMLYHVKLRIMSRDTDFDMVKILFNFRLKTAEIGSISSVFYGGDFTVFSNCFRSRLVFIGLSWP